MAAIHDNEIVDVNPSELGTKEYWDHFYERDLKIFEEDGDPGDAWFGEQAVKKMVHWVEQNYQDRFDLKIMDIGCGNGHLLFELAEREFSNLIGVDYSQKAIDLANAWAASQDEQATQISFEVGDLLSSEFLDKYNQAIDLVLDKGTYDAISLSPTGGRQELVNVIWQILKPDGIFLITSCNWTDEELQQAFRNGFEVHSRVKQTTFSFGGKVGQNVTTLAFKRTQRQIQN